MKVYCLTSITAEETRQDRSGFASVKETITQLKEYAFTEIEIGYDDNYTHFEGDIGTTKLTYFFVVHREDGHFCIRMEPGAIKMKEKTKLCIELEIFQDDPGEDVIPKIIRIRNIKIPKKVVEKKKDVQKQKEARKMREEDSAKYEDYVNSIKEYCIKNPDCSIENAFDINKMERGGEEKSLRQKVRALMYAIRDLCDPESGSTDNVPENARYKDSTPMNKDICILDQKYHHLLKYNKNSWGSLIFVCTIMSKFDTRWFDAKNLVKLKAIEIKISQKMNEKDWEEFANGIKNCKKLESFTFQANLDIFPTILFENLPISIKKLNLSKNNLTSISSEISRLINLKKLDLTYNKNLKDIPWESLPPSIEILKLCDTGITIISKEIKRLSSLDQLYMSDMKVENVPCTCLSKKLKYLEIINVRNVEESVEFILPELLETLAISNSLLKSFNTEILSKNKLNYLFLNNNRIEHFEFRSNMQELTVLDLSNNAFKSFPWECIPNLNSLQCLDLSKNEIECLGSMKYWMKLLSLNVSSNKIESFIYDIDKDYDFDKDGYKYSDQMTEKMIYLKDGISLNISFNKLHSLPTGFENFDRLKELNIGWNSAFKITEIKESLWNRLPLNGKLSKLCISGIKVKFLPCMIQNLPLIQLDAVDCDLHYICPQISRKQKYSDFVLNIRQNEALKKLSFFPKTVLPFPDSKAKGEEIDNFPEPEFYSKDWLELNWENTSETIEASYNIQIFGEEGYCGSSREKKLNFKEAETTEENYFCKCCANCGKGAEEKIVEQLITMDICLFQITKKGIEKWNPETWRSQIKTRLCEECKEWYKNEAKKIYVPSKRKPYKRKLENQQGESEQQNQIVEVTTAVLSQDCTSSLPPSSNHSYPCEYSQPSTSAFGQLVSSNVSAPQQNMEYIYYESDVPSFNYEIHHTTDASINNGNFGDFHLIPAHSNPTDYYYSLYPSSDVYGQHLNQNYVLPHENQQVPFFGFSSTSQTTSTNMFQQSHGATSNYFTHLNSAPGLDETFVENDVLKKKK